MVLPFAVEPLDVRGRVVRLGPAIDEILARHAYPPPVARLVGEAAALTVLLGAALKSEGRLQLQTRSDGIVDMIVVDFDAPDRLRAFARFDEAKLAEVPPGAELARPRPSGADDRAGQRCRALSGRRRARRPGARRGGASIFPPIRADPDLRASRRRRKLDGRPQRAGAPGGLMLQFLPASIERQRQADLAPGDAPEGAIVPETLEDDAWAEAKALAATIEDHELVDPGLSSERLLYRLFHERGVKVFAPQTVRAACRCSRRAHRRHAAQFYAG